jgi:uncharacterized protein with FMN-binding domain
MDTDPEQQPRPPGPIDPVLQDRLARLTSDRSRPAPPPVNGRTTPPARRRRKRHAAKRTRAAAMLMSAATAAGLAGYFQHAGSATASNTTFSLGGDAVASPAVPATAVASTTAAKTNPSSPGTSATTTTAATVTASTLADGTYVGATATNKWGPVQVQITVTSGHITKAVALQTPTDDRKSVTINQRATPTLATEALSAQNATIDSVSGATYTSDSYKASLQSAIDLAHATAVQSAATS